MDIGVCTDVIAEGMPIADLARAAEGAGLESLFVTQHTHIPSVRADVLQEANHDTDADLLDPFVALAVAAAVTSSVRLGTGICLAAQYDPILLAKQVASLDVVSDGRVVFGVGAGWLDEEMRNHGLEPRDRFSVLREHVLAMKAIWTQDTASFHGAYVNFEAIWLGPRPIQRPHPPVLVAGQGSRALRRVLDYGDGWYPVVETVADIETHMTELELLCREAGRDPVPVTAGLWDIDEPLIERCAELGVRRCVFWLPPGKLGTVQPLLDRLSSVSRSYGN